MQYSKFPITTYNVPLNHTHHMAAVTMMEIQKIVAEKELNPANLVILDGQHYSQLTNVFFAPALARELQWDYRKISLCEERSFDRQADLQPAETPTHKNFLSLLSDKSQANNYNAGALMAAWKGVPYYAIDMQARTEFAPIDKRDRLAAYFTSPQPVIYVTGGLPEEFATSLKEYPFFVRMFHKNGEILKDNEIDARSETGMTRRDLFMAERILKRQDESGAPVVVAAGKSHMVDTDSPRRPALLEMLTELGKDIIYISHVKDTRGSIKAQEHQDLLFAEAHKGMLETMPEHQRSHYHACFILNSPACWEAGDWSKQGIETFLKSQLI